METNIQLQPNGSKLATSCEHCIFAKTNSKGAQTGCRWNYLDRIDNKTMQENGYYLINGRACLPKRHKDWAAKQDTQDIEVLKQRVRNVIKIRYHLIIIDYKNQYKDIMTTLANAKLCSIKPEKITIIKRYNDDTLKIAQYIDEHFKCPWSVANIPEEDELNFSSLNVVMTDSQKSPYILVCTAGKLIPVNYIANIDKKINDLAKVISFGVPTQTKHLLCANNFVYQKLAGCHFGTDIYQKIKDNPFLERYVDTSH